MPKQAAKREARQPIRPLSLWYGVAAGPVIWAVHLVMVYALQTLSCDWGWLAFDVLGIQAARLTLIVVTTVAVAAILGGGFIALTHWRRLRHEQDRQPVLPEDGRFLFMTYAGVAFSLFFAGTTALKLAPILTLGICAR